MHLYGLNDLNMTLEEFISKSTEIASRKIRHEAMLSAQDLSNEQMNDTMRGDLLDFTDSGTY